MLAAAGMALVVSVLIFAPVFAVEYGGGNAQSYESEQPIDHGAVVELTGDNSDRVKIATQKELQNMFGVVVDPQHLPIRITSGSPVHQVYVAVSGTYNVLVSDQAGEVKPGDFVTLSAVNGVAMKAGTEEPTVFGRAAAAFGENSHTLSETVIKDTDGNETQKVKIGSIPVTIDIRSNPNEKTTKANVPEFLERVGQAIAEKEVSPIRIYISTGVAAVSLITALIVIYAGIRNGVISIGRNPMSKKSIFRAILESILTSLVILIIGLFAVYLLLRL